MRACLSTLMSLCAACAVMSLAPAARAQSGAPAAEALFAQGRAAMAAGDYDTACARYRESDRIDPAVGTKLNLADCEHRRGNLATAWELFQAAEREMTPTDDRLSFAQEQAAALDARVPRLTLRLAAGAPEQTTVRIAYLQVGAAGFGVPLPMNPGRHELVVSAPGYAPQSHTVVLAEGQRREIAIAPGPQGSDDGGSAEPSWMERHGWSVGLGTGAIALASAGAILGGLTWSDYDELAQRCGQTAAGCPQEDIDAVETKATATTVLFAVAGAAAATSVVLYLFVEDGDEPEPSEGGPASGSVALGLQPAGASLLVRY